MAITNHIKGAVEKFKAKTGTDLQDHVLNATYLNGLEGTSYVDLTSAQTITGTKTFDVAYANVFATGTGAGNYFQCQKFRGEGNASTYYHAVDFGFAGHNQVDFYEYGGIYNFYQNTTADGSGKVNLFQISPDGVTSHKPLIAESTLTAKGAFTSSASTTLSNIKNAGILGTDSSGKVCDNSNAYQKAGNYATKSDLSKYQPKGDYVTYDNASKDIYLGSHGIHSGTRPSSDSATLMGNGYWIQESSVGVSSAVTGGVAVSSEMTPDYISVSNRKIILNSSGIKSDAGTFKFDGNPGSVATSADIKNLQTELNGKANTSHTHAISDVIDLQTRLDGKMDTYTITKEPSSMGKNGFAQFGYDIRYQLTRYSELQRAFGYVRAVEKGGQVSNNNSYFTGFGEVGGGTYIGTATYDRDYNFTTDALYTSHGLLIDAYGSAFLLSGSKNSETKKELATKDDTNSLQNSINGKANIGHTHAISEITNLQSTLDRKVNLGHTHAISAISNLQSTLNGKQATLVSGTNIKTINGNSILGGGNLSIFASLDEKKFHDIINATSSISSYIVIDKLLIQWGVYIGAHGNTISWEVTYPKEFWYYPAVILQTKDTNTNNQGLPYSNGAVITSYRNGTSFTFQLRRSESCPVYWIAIGGLR